jgi:hypothetical protein
MNLPSLTCKPIFSFLKQQHLTAYLIAGASDQLLFKDVLPGKSLIRWFIFVIFCFAHFLVI